MPEEKTKKKFDYRNNYKNNNPRSGKSNENQKKYNNNNKFNKHYKNKEIEVVSYTPQTRKTKGTKKTIEVTNPEGEKDNLKIIKLDDDSTTQEIIDTVHEFETFCDDNEVYGDYEYDAADMPAEQIEAKEKVLMKAAENIFKY